MLFVKLVIVKSWNTQKLNAVKTLLKIWTSLRGKERKWLQDAWQQMER